MKNQVEHTFDDDDDYDERTRQLRAESNKSLPAHELREMLSLRTSDYLKRLARKYGTKNYASLRKEKIIDLVFGILSDADFVESVLRLTDDSEFRFFEYVALSDEVTIAINEASEKPYRFFLRLYFMEAYCLAGQVTFVVPDTIKTIYYKLQGTSFPKTRKRYNTINSFANAFSLLYGVTDMEEFVPFCSAQLDSPMEPTALENVMYDFIWKRNVHYLVCVNCLVHKSIDEYTELTELEPDYFEESNEEVSRIESERGSLPRKDLPPEAILKYSDPWYFENRPEHERLMLFIKEINPEIACNEDLIKLILGELSRRLMNTDDHGYDISIDLRDHESDEEVMQTLRNLIDDVERHTRKWSKNGWTLAELRDAGLS